VTSYGKPDTEPVPMGNPRAVSRSDEDLDSCDVLALCELWRELDFPDERGTVAAIGESLKGAGQ
jgi:hypothetical protein